MTDGYYILLDILNPMDVYETVDRVPLPLDVIPPSTLFMPMGGGNEYSKARLKEEFRHCLAQAAQLRTFDLPDYLFALRPLEDGLVTPGAPLGMGDRRRQDPQPFHSVETRERDNIVERGNVEGDDEEWEDEDEEDDEDDSKYPHPDHENTLFDYDTSEVIRERFSVPLEREDLLLIRGLFDAQSKSECIGIAIGTNYGGVANETTEAAIREVFDIKGEERWHLNSQRWFWTRNPLWLLLKAKKLEV
ncbi:hypothetical protein BC629DRAFT_1436831 [Irpex lacteus]|nr:hypothetical protein BC629DRAFT_1436831 [Irpex lacteus]